MPNKKLRKIGNDIQISVFFLIFAAIYFAETFRFPIVTIPNTITATFFPRIVAALITVCALAILIRSLRAYKALPAEDKTQCFAAKSELKGLVRIAEVFVVLLAAAMTFRKLGFLLTMPWMMFLLFIILEKKENRKYDLYLSISLVAPIFMYALFYYGFSTLLPMGILKPYLSLFL